MEVGGLAAQLAALRASEASAVAEVGRLRAELGEVVDEYSVLEREAEGRAGAVVGVGRALADVSRACFAALRSVWAVHAAAPSPAYLAGGGGAAAADSEAAEAARGVAAGELQRAMLAALAQQGVARRALAAAGLPELAALAGEDDVSDLLATVQAYSPDVAHRTATARLTDAIRELDADRARLARVADGASDRAAAAERAVAARDVTIASLTAALEAARTTAGSHVAVGGRLVSAEEVEVMEGELRRFRDEVAALSSSTAAAAGVVAAAAAAAAGSPSGGGGGGGGGPDAAALVAAIAAESAAYLTRATEAEARAESLASQLSAARLGGDTEASRLRSEVSAGEHATAQLTRTVTSLRAELEMLQEKYTAREGVVDMLRAELADAHTRLSKLQAHKTAMAQKAALALREVEGQVHSLTAVVASMKDQRGGGGGGGGGGAGAFLLSPA